jgi:hypothetical protein
VCRRYRWGSFESTGRAAEVQVPASATGSDVAFDLVLSGVDGGLSNLVVGDASWGWSTGASMSAAAASSSDNGLRGWILTRPTSILGRDADPSMIWFSWDCLGEDLGAHDTGVLAPQVMGTAQAREGEASSVALLEP